MVMTAMTLMRALAVLPFLGILLGAVVLRGATQLVLGVPALLAWLLAWIVLTSAIIGIIYACDRQTGVAGNRGNGPSAKADGFLWD